VSEVHHAAVRAKLNKHCYHQHLGSDSVLLAETMINDLIASSTSLSDLQEKDDEKRKELQLMISELEGLRIENPRLKAENNALHLQIIEAVEAAEIWEASIRQNLQSLEDEIDSTKLAMQHENRRSAQKEVELQQLQMEAATMLGIDDGNAKPCDSLPERSTFQLDAEPLMAKEESLSESLYQCRKNLLHVESNVVSAVKRSKDLESQAEFLCEELFESSTPSQPLRLRAMQAQLEVEASEQRQGLEELELHGRELEEHRYASDQKRRQLQEKVKELHTEEATLLADEAKEATKAMELLKASEVEASMHQRHLKEAQERYSTLQTKCQRLRGSTEVLSSRLNQLSRDEVVNAAEQSKKVKALLDQLVSVQSGPGAPSTLQLQQLEDQLQRAQEESIRLGSSKAALEEEVQAASLQAKMQARHLETQRASMEGDIQSGAEVQSRWSSAGAQLQWLNASLSSITDEHLLLKSHLQEQQVSLHEESLQRVQIDVEVQRLQATVTSLDHTREEWMADLSRAVASLRQAHGSLTTTLQQEENVQMTSDQLRHQLLSSERNLHAAAQQHQEMVVEVDDWTSELRENTRHRDEACSTALQLMNELREASSWDPKAQRQLSDSDTLLDKVRGEVLDFQDRLARLDTEIASLKSKAKRSELVTERRLEYGNSLSVCSAELAASEIATEAITSKCWQLQEDIQEKATKLSAAEASSRKLEDELATCQHRLNEVNKSEQNAIAGWGDEQRAAARELELLRKAATSLDSERDEKQRVADERAQEVDDLKHAIEDHKRSLQEAQQTLDDLRSTADRQQKHLDQQQGLRRDRSDHVEALRQHSERLKMELVHRNNEVTCVQDDLQHMVKENQELHEEVRKLETSVTARTADARKQLQQQEMSAQELHAIELERADVARLHEQISLENREQEVSITRLNNDKDLARRVAGELAAELRRVQGLQDTWHDRAEQYQLDMLVIQEQISDINQRVSSCEESQQKALEEDARLKGDVAAAVAAAQGADRNEAVEAHAVASLRLRRHQIQSALQQTKVEIASQKRSAEETWSQVKQLQELLELKQVKLNRCTAELQALQKFQSSSITSSSPLALGGNDALRSRLKDLVEQRYAKVGELDAEQQRLKAEVMRLRAGLDPDG